MDQADFFRIDALPSGMRYQPDFLEPVEEEQLLSGMRTLPFREARYKEWTARRRILPYGGRYDFTRNELQHAEPIPDLLHPVRQRLATWAGIDAESFNQGLINEYRPGTPLGWHRDAPVYEVVVGLSLAGTGRMRLRPYPPRMGGRKGSLTLELAPRSAYCLSGPARWEWQHAISPARELRYSITFRTLVRRLEAKASRA